MASHFLGLWLFFGFFKGPHPWGFLLYNLGALGWCISIQVHSLQLLLKPLRMWLLSPAIFCWGFSILLDGSIRQGPGWPQLGSFFCMTPICFPGNTRTFLAPTNPGNVSQSQHSEPCPPAKDHISFLRMEDNLNTLPLLQGTNVKLSAWSSETPSH